MFSKPFAVGALVIACVTAAAGGAFVAVRQNQASTAPPAAAGAFQPSPTSPAVQDTEAVVAPAPRADAAQPPLQLERTRPVAEAPKAPPAARASQKPSTEVPARSRPQDDRRPAAASETARTPTNSPASATSSPAVVRPDASAAVAPPPVEAPRPEPPPAPPLPVFEELVVPASAVMGLQIQTAVTTERARVEDRVEARVTRDLAVDGRTAIPEGTRVIGSVTLVERGGKVKERARLGVRFHTLVLADGTELGLRTEPILREGESPTGDSTRKIGGAAVGGAILGAIIGGKKGAIVGGATGAAGGTAVVMAGDRNAATLPVGAVVTVRLSAPLTVAVEKH